MLRLCTDPTTARRRASMVVQRCAGPLPRDRRSGLFDAVVSAGPETGRQEPVAPQVPGVMAIGRRDDDVLRSSSVPKPRVRPK